MLPKRRRLNAQEVRRVLRGGKAVRSESVSARYREAEGSKAAVVVSSKVVRGAAERNRIRRRAYEILQNLPPNKHLVLFIQKKEFNPADIASLCSKLS